MRMMQKEYFRSRDKFYLVECKKIEKNVDDQLKGIQSLFDDQAAQEPAKLTEEDKRKIIDEFLNWQSKFFTDNPTFRETRKEDVIKMFLFESE